MAWLKLTKNALYLMKSGSDCYLKKVTVSPTSPSSSELRLHLPLDWFSGRDVPSGMIVDLESAEPKPWTLIQPLNDSSLPLLGRVVVLDPGHGEIDAGINDPGAVSPTGVTERDLVRQQADMIKANLEALGATVKIVENGTGMSLTEIGAQGRGADCFVSLHLNSFNREVQGHEVLIDPDGTAFDAKLANCINDELDSEFEFPNRGVKKQGLAVLRGVPLPTPAVLVESFFIDEVKDTKLLESWNFRASIVISQGITKFLR